MIKEKAEYFSGSEDDIGITSVVSHIEIAERHFDGGKAGDDYLFNDVIYRSNQAFEGALKEAYRIITGNDSNRITPHKIEQHFEKNSVLKDRVLQLFTNYRTEWRNKSTHDYKLYFSEQEAFLGIVNISAFVNILFDQMIEKRAYEKEKEDLKSKPKNPKPGAASKSLFERIIELLKDFSLEIPNKTVGTTLPRITELELIGSLTAYINESADDIEVFTEYAIMRNNNMKKYYADFLLQLNEEKVIIEIKNTIRNQNRILSSGTDQLLNYLTASAITKGILFIPPIRDGVVEIKKVIKEIGGINYEIVQVYPMVN
ncbi:MAG: GxxExxY protein [Bacteroidales bacterium]|nr:GxxExxY protein [Bacteroidales bacterium]